MKILVLGLGNDLLADDAIGPLAVRELGPRLAGRAEVVASALHGLALLDPFLDYDGAVIIDAASTGGHPVWTVYEIDPAGLPGIVATSGTWAVTTPR